MLAYRIYVTSCHHVQQITWKRYRICGGDLTRNSYPHNHYTKKGDVREQPQGSVDPPPLQHTSLANNSACERRDVCSVNEVQHHRRTTQRLPHYWRFAPGVVCEARPDFTQTLVQVRRVLLFVDSGRSFNAGDGVPSWGLVERYCEGWTRSDRTGTCPSDTLSTRCHTNWPEDSTLASTMWWWRLTVWTTARPLAHRAHLFVRMIPRPRREQFVNSINHPVFSDWYDESSWVYAINIYTLHGLPAGQAAGGAVGWGTALQAGK